jgi:acetyl-CoA synthetase
MTSKIYKVPEDFAALAHLKHADYLRLYQESVRDPHAVWGRKGRRNDRIQPNKKLKDTS